MTGDQYKALLDAWNELALAEHACFDDALTFGTVKPILQRFAQRIIAEVSVQSKRLAEFGEKTGASPWT